MNDNPNLQPTLTGQRVIIRPVKSQDWDEMFAVASDPEIWAVHPVRDRYTEPVFRQFFDGAMSCGSAFSFVDRQTGKIFGSSRYHGHDATTREIEIGWTFLSRGYWGGSYNLEIKQLMLNHAFTFADTVVFWVGESNIRSRRAVEKIGGVLRKETQIRGNALHVVYEIRNEG
jgi:RimJ/RimL family protein N-acetyltransferase